MLIDIINRHQIESKRTSDFLKYALGNRSKDPGEAPLSLFRKTSPTKSRLPLIASTAKKQRVDKDTIFSSDLKSLQKTRLPKLMNNKSLNSQHMLGEDSLQEATLATKNPDMHSSQHSSHSLTQLMEDSKQQQSLQKE